MATPRRRMKKKVTLDGAIIVPPWFADAGYPVRTGNVIRPLVDGEEAFREIYRALEAARETIHISTWWLEPGFPIRWEGRQKVRLGELLKRKGASGVAVRLLLWDAMFKQPARVFGALSEFLFQDIEGVQEYVYDIDWFERARAGEMYGVEVVMQPFQMPEKDLGWEEILFSHHQKTVVVDGTVGFCSGMNWRRVDWDTSEHSPRDPRRWGVPRHDLCARVEGPVVMDLEHNFYERWNAAVPPEKQLAFKDIPWVAPIPKAGFERLAQITRTRRQTGDATVVAMYRNAIANAQEYIYIENQYFRSSDIARAIADRLRVRPDLEVIVVTMEDDKLYSPSSGHTFQAIRILEEAYREVGREEFRAYCLYTHNPDPWWLRWLRRLSGESPLDRYHPINLHAKVMIVDDQFFTIGSANINLRSMEYDSEINVGALDPAGARALRLKLWREHLDPAERVPPEDDIREWVELWRQTAQANEEAVERDAPLRGNVRFIENKERMDNRIKPKIFQERWVFHDPPEGVT